MSLQSERIQLLMQRLCLTEMVHGYEALAEQAAQKNLPYCDFLEQVLESEANVRQERNIKVRTQLAGFPDLKRLEQFDFKFPAAIDEKKIRELASLRFLERHENAVFLGPPGVGKTHLAVSLGSVLKNPIYAGAYAYGRSKTTVRLAAGQKQVRRQVRRRREDWAVLILDHHEGYIDWDVYQSNQTMIAHNDNARGNAVRGPIKHGEALLAGLLRCGHCGAKLLAQYPGPRVIRYQCSGYLLNRDHACCVMFGGLRADRLVSEQLMQSLAPFGIAAAIEAIESLQGASDERIQQKALALEHARYEVTRTRRQYDAVDPANRLVAAELERRWNQALTTEAQIEAELVTLQEGREGPLTDTQKRELLSFARDLPTLWDDPQSLPEHKKRLLRIALKEIIATCEGETIRLILHWQGGDHTQVEFEKIRSGRHRYVTDDDLVEIVGILARIEPDARIASILNRNQRRTAHGDDWTAKRICSLRNNHAIPVHREGERQARGEMSVSEVAAALGVTPTTVLRLIRLKQLRATQACVGAPWILRRTDVERCVAERNHPATPPTVDSAQLTLEIP